MITLEQFRRLPHNRMFACGVATDGPKGLHMTGSERTLHWVAVKGLADDWAMYCGYSDDLGYAQAYGDKVHGDDNIQRVLSVSPEVLALYRG